MSLTSGTRLGPYEIVSQVGAGGMGEVYKATDTRLNRTIAIKVLPEHLASDPQRLARFQREARTISSLNHPHICALHDVGDENGTHFLVMEYVEGEALDQRLQKGPVPLDDALEYAKQIADALDKAHLQGIVHRDLKPANVMITKSGVKLLDFGLAKLTGDSESSSPLSQLNTQGDSGLTAEGTIMGTFRYMAPEQVEGKDVDARTDIYALCLVIYEMITGQRAIDGETQASLIAAILKDKPTPITELQPITPPQLDRVVQTGLEKDPEKRWQSAREVRHALEWIGLEAPAAAQAKVVETKQLLLWKGVAAAALAVAALVVVWSFWPDTTPVAESMQFEISLPEGTRFGQYVRVSPDGLKVAFTAVGSQPGLWLHDVTNGSTELLPDTANANAPFWSPDSQSIGFGDDNILRIVEIRGGDPRTVVELDPEFPVGSGAWNEDGVILFGRFGLGGGGWPMKRVTALGADLRNVTPMDPDVTPFQPSFLGDGRHFIYFNTSTVPEKKGMFVGSLDVEPREQGTERLLAVDYGAIYVPPSDEGVGHVLYIPESGTLMAREFDEDSLRFLDNAWRVATGVSNGASHGHFSAAANTLVYHRGESGPPARDLIWYDSALGSEGEFVGNIGSGVGLANRIDDLRVPFSRPTGPGETDIWIADLARDGALEQITFAAGADRWPVWSPDGQTVAFASDRDGPANIYLRPLAGGPDSETAVRPSQTQDSPSDWSSDGYLVYESEDVGGGSDVLALLMDGSIPEGEPLPIVSTQYNEWGARISPDNRWVAYVSDRQEGEEEIFVQAFPGPGQPIRVSTNGGSAVQWGADERMLFYVGSDGWLMSVELEPSFEGDTPVLTPELPVRLFEVPDDEYIVHDGGQRFLFMAPSGSGDTATDTITFITNWRERGEQ